MAEQQGPHFAVRVAKGLLYAVLLLAVILVALTQTQVGRDGLRGELERQFDRQFEGHLSIGELSGNLVQDLFASEVALYDPDGRLVASVDSAVARPAWRSIIDGNISIRSLTLYRPQFHLARGEELGWNIERAISARGNGAGDDGASYWIDLPLTRIVDGEMSIYDERADSPFARYANGGRLQALHVNAAGEVAWNSTSGLNVALRSFTASLPEVQQEIHDFRGTVRLDTARIELADARARLAWSDITIDGRWDFQNSDSRFTADFDADPVDFDELRRFIPDLPFHGPATASGSVSGNLSRFSVDNLYLSHESSFIHTTGTVDRSGSGLTVDADELRTRLAPADLRTFFPPAAPFVEKHVGGGEGRFSGDMHLSHSEDGWQFQSTDLQLAADTRAGRASGRLLLDRRGAENWRYDADLSTTALDLDRLSAGHLPARNLTGTIRATGGGPITGMTGSLALDAESAVVSGRALGPLHIEAESDSGLVLGNARLVDRGGVVQSYGQIDLREGRNAYYLNSFLSGVDLRSVIDNDSLETRLNGNVETRGWGFSLAALESNWSIELDSSLVRWGSDERVVLPQRLDATLSSLGEGGSSFEIQGDAFDLQIESGAPIRSTVAQSGRWIQTASTQLNEYFQEHVTPDTVRTASGNAIPDSDPSQHTRAAVNLRVNDGALLASLFPALPSIHSDLEVSAEADLAGDEAALSGEYSSSLFSVQAFQGYGFGGRFGFAVEHTAEGAMHFEGGLSGQADSVLVADRVHLREPVLDYRQIGEEAELELNSAPRNGSGPLRIAADMRVRRGANTLLVQSVSYETARQHWRLAEAAPMTFSQTRLEIPGFRLIGETPEAVEDQFLSLEGTLSNEPQDTLLVEASDLQIFPAAEFTLAGRPIGGLLNGRFAITGGIQQPEITGRVLVDHLSFDNRLLGHLELHSAYQPGTPDVEIQASLHSARDVSRLRLAPDSTPLIPSENALDLTGSLRLPGFTPEGLDAAPDPGSFDLDVDVQRAEVFIFEYIFADLITQTDGFLTGQGHIGGTFSRPVFDADLRAVNGSFSVPDFNLHYAVDGSMLVDREGITFDDVRLTDPQDGRAAVNGRLLFNDYQYFSFDLQADLDELQIINVRNSRVLPFYGTIAASGPAHLTGPLHAAHLRAPNVRTTSASDLFIPVTDEEYYSDAGFLIFADEQGRLPDLRDITHRRSVLADRPAGERTFLDGLEMDLNINAPSGSTVHLVFDALLGDAMSGQGSGRIQLQRQEGEIRTYGTFEVDSGEYLFTAGELFFRRFHIDEGTIHWDGSPVDAELDITASYRTRASAAGLSNAISSARHRIPLVVQLQIRDRVSLPSVELSLAIDRSDRTLSEDYAATALETVLNQTERETEYATSVLLTNTFLLTTELQGGEEGRLTDTGNRLAFNSLSQLVASQLNRYLNEALPNIDVVLDVQGENPQDLDVIYGVALRLMDERLIIRGEGVWTDNERRAAEGMEGEFIVEVRFSPTISVEAFHRREGSLLAEQVLTSTTGAGISYQTQFPTWKQFLYNLFGWALPEPESPEPTEVADEEPVATRE